MPGPGYYWIGREEERQVVEVVRSKHLNRHGEASDPNFRAKVVTLEKMVAQRLGIEYTAQAFGARLEGCGLGRFGAMGTFSFNISKTINAGDGGMVVCHEKGSFETAFGIHDQGRKPVRMGLEVGKRSMVGFNFRMNERTAALLIAQLEKLDKLLADLRRINGRLKERLRGIEGLEFRFIPDPAGECATLLVLMLPNAKIARTVAANLGTVPICDSGSHVNGNMENIHGKRQLTGGPPFRSREFRTDVNYQQGMLPRTDNILSRSISIGIGVVDSGLGSVFGLHPRACDEEIDAAATRIEQAVTAAL